MIRKIKKSTYRKSTEIKKDSNISSLTGVFTREEGGILGHKFRKFKEDISFFKIIEPFSDLM
jgi:hypothetical protein